MSDHYAADGAFINSIVGEGTMFRGELNLSGLLRIDGDFSGSITTTGKVLVGKNGRAECTIKADTVVIGGIVRGNIVSAEKVIVLSTGMVIGNISTPRLVVEEGVILNGSCLIAKNAGAGATQPSAADHVADGGSGSLRDAPAEHAPSNHLGAVQDEGVDAPQRRELSSWNR